jgi:glycosyltransferase involved in cell wall biosynthesis
MFLDRFADLPDLMRYLSETDIFVAPYLNLDQMTSGALAYAVGAGKATVATPFLHARELLDGGRGSLVPTGDPGALADAVLELLENDAKMTEMRRKAYQHTRKMVWPAVAREYLDLFDRVAKRKTVSLGLERRPSITPERTGVLPTS